MNDLVLQKCESEFFDQKILLQQPRTVYRIDNYSSGRYYYTLDGNGEPTFYISVTNMIGSTLPTSPHLIKWIANMGYEESQEYKDERADYGTFMHMQIANLLIKRKIDLDKIYKELVGYCKEQGLEGKADEWIDEIKKDVLAFAQFMLDYKVKPIAIEMVLAHPDGYAGAIDLLCDMEVEVKGYYGEVYKSGPNKDKPKETKKVIKCRGYVDFKSGRKGFYEAHEIQLQAYHEMGKFNFPHLYKKGQPPIKLFNWSPKEWKTSPSYNLKDQTYSVNKEKFDLLVNLAAIEMKKRKKTKLNISGVLDIDAVMTEKQKLDNYYKLEQIETIIKSKTNEPSEAKSK